jgi:site-specific DNA recombinase
MARRVGYARVSTEGQALTPALNQQISRLLEAGAEEIFYDVESGNKEDRKQLKKILELVTNKQVSEVIATRWDRLTRNYNLYLEIKKIFKSSEVKLKLLDGGEVDLKTANGELSSDLQVVFSVYERLMIRERVNKGFEAKRKREVAWIRPPWGCIIVNEKYELNNRRFNYCLLKHQPNNYYELYNEPDNSDKLQYLTYAKLAREIFDYFFQTRYPTKVLKYLNQNYGLSKNLDDLLIPELKDFPTSGRGIKQWLQNPVFQGHTAYLKYKKDGGVKPIEEWDIRFNTHPEQRLITDEEAEEIQSILAFNSKNFGQTDATFYLSGHIFCGRCKSKCTLKSARGKNIGYYGCRHSSTICKNRGNVRISQIETAIIKKLVDISRRIAENPSQYESHKSPKLRELELQYEHLEKIPGSDFNPALKTAKQTLMVSIEEERNKLNNIAEDIILHPIAKKINFWYTLTEKERKVLYDKLLDRVIILDKQVAEVKLKVGF